MREITIAHSPDADDAFMFYALAKGKVDSETFRFRHAMHDIETLNRRAVDGTYEVTALSFHAFAHLQERYRLLPVGASLGDGCGPLIVAAGPASPEEVRGKRIAVPGERTTAHLVLRLFQPDIEAVFVDFDRVMEAVLSGETPFGVIIHEGQVTFADEGLHAVLDLGEWWKKETSLPLPLGANAVRQDITPVAAKEIARSIRASIQYALDHREEALDYALGFGRGVDRGRGDRFVEMYVNSYTLDLGERGKEAVRTLLARSSHAGLTPKSGTVPLF